MPTFNAKDSGGAITAFQVEADSVGNREVVSVQESGVYGYAAGTATGTIDVPSAARLKRVSVLANATSSTTVTIGGGATITVVAGGVFDEQVPGTATGADVVIAGGAPQSYYVSWVA